MGFSDALAGIPVMVGDRALFDRGADQAAAAERLFPNQGLQAAARAFAVAHERAVQYLEQAPVLVFAVIQGGPGVRRVNALYMQHRLVPMCEAGVPLKTMMREFGLPYPLRKLRPYALTPGSGPTIYELASLVPLSTLGRVIPPKPGAQRKWLAALVEWRAKMHRRQRPTGTLLAWAADVLAEAKAGPRDIVEVIDFIAAGEAFNEEWRWARANEEATLWHDRLGLERALRSSPFSASSVIDTAYHPDLIEVDGLDFIALRTPEAIAAEGRAMRHCVTSYIPMVIRGECHIIGIRRGDERVATLELTRAWSINQLKGKLNAAPSPGTAGAALSYARIARDEALNAAKNRTAL